MARNPTAEEERLAFEDAFIESLAKSVLAEALVAEGPGYALTDGGKLWLGVLGLDPNALVEAMHDTVQDTSVPLFAVALEK